MDVSPPTNDALVIEITPPWRMAFAYTVSGKPNFPGNFRLAGDAPDGLVLSNSIPVARPVRVYHRATGELIAEVMSASDGTWQVTGLSDVVDLDVQFMGTAPGEKDVLVPKVRAS